MATRPLAKALHTVTVVQHVNKLRRAICALADSRPGFPTAEEWAYDALKVLGYSAEQCDANPALFAACVKAVQA